VTPRLRRVLVWSGAATLLSALDGSALFLALPAISAEFHARVPSLANLASVIALGALGALPLGLLADRRGRRLLVAGGTAGFGLADIASAAAPSLAALAAFRVLAVVFETAVAESAVILVVEETPAQHRGLAVAAMTFAAGLGAGLASVAYPLLAPHWRLLYLAGAVAVPVALLVWLRLPESRAWAEARRLPPIRWRGAWVRRLSVLLVAALLAAVLYEPAGIFLAYYGSSALRLTPVLISAVVLVSSIVGGLAYLGGGWLTDRIGRRLLGVLLAFLSALGNAAIFAGGLPLYWAGNLAGSAAGSAASPVVGAWMAELLPTRARVTAEVLDVAAGAVGGVAGLQLAAQLSSRLGLGRAIALEGAFAVLGALVLLLLPETRGAPLEA
jgi:SHS family sialic acid transporter-like MFS transporter